MTSSVSGTGSVSSAGIGSGLDVETIVTKLMSVEQAPLKQLQTKAGTIRTSISAYGAVKSATSTFRDAAAALTRPATWSATTATSSDTTTVATSSTSSAASGSYAVVVTALAKAQSTASPVFASADALVGAGTLSIDLGTWAPNNGPFTSRSAPIAVTTDATDTLATLSTKINAANAGVNASVITDATGSRLVLSSTATGAANGFRVTGGADALAASGFAYTGTGGTTTLSQAGSNAAATINGLSVSSAGNTLDGMVQGLTMTLNAVGTAQVTVGRDTESMKTAIKTFVDSYNALNTLIATDTKYDAASKTAAPLQGDSTAVSLQRQMRAILGSSSSASAVYSTLSQAGLQIQTDGSIKTNDATLANAIANPTEIKALFGAVALPDGTNAGFARRFMSLGDSVLGLDGLLSARVTGLNTSLTKNQKDQDTTQRHLDSVEAALRAQYSALDKQMAGINALSTYVTQQIAAWNKPSA